MDSDKQAKMSRRLLARLPPGYCHLQGSVGGEEGGLQGQVRHGAGFVLASDPSLDGFSLIGITICGEDVIMHVKKKKIDLSRKNHKHLALTQFFFRPTCSNDWILHQLCGDWTHKLIRNL